MRNNKNSIVENVIFVSGSYWSICYNRWISRMDTVEMKAFHMMENREDVAVARATAGMIMMANSKEGGQSETI